MQSHGDGANLAPTTFEIDGYSVTGTVTPVFRAVTQLQERLDR